MDRLIMLLSEKEQIMEEMARSLTEEQSRIIEMNSAAVEESTRNKEEVTTRLGRVATACRELMAVVGAERGVDEGGTLSPLIAAASESEKDLLEPLQRRMLLLGKTLERQQELNRKLLAHALGFIDKSMSLFGRLLGGCDTYGAGGRVTTGTSSLRFISREM
jgi:FlgN protein